MLKSCIILPLIISLALSGCATIYNPATGQNEFIFITTPMEVSIGKAVAANISTQFKFSKDQQKIKRLTEIGEKVALVSDRRDLKYNFTVIEDKSLNAFATPGGHVYVHSGLMDKANDDELACVVAHEVGHVAARHIAKKLQAQMGYDIVMNIAARRAGIRELQKAASLSYNLIMLGYSRQDELLSDRLGVKYAYKAHYDPYAMITFLKKLKEAKDEEMSIVFLRTHPYISERIKTLEKAIPAIIKKADTEKNTAPLQYEKQKRETSKLITSSGKRPLKVKCPECRRIFSGQTNYCPYDGSRL